MVICMNKWEFIKLHPKLYHMAEADSWESIKFHGLLSTEALLDLFEVKGIKRNRILYENRRSSTYIEHPEHGKAIIRDQIPMTDGALEKCLIDGLTPCDWYRILNRKTFFWTTKERLFRLLGAKAYRDKKHIVIKVDTEKLFQEYEDRITLSPINSGSTIFKPQTRGLDTFSTIDQFDIDRWLKKRSLKNVFVELVVDYKVENIEHFTEQVVLMHGQQVVETIV